VTTDTYEETLHVTAWPDPVLDSLGHDPRSAYVERFWLAFLGPSTTFLLRRLVAVLEDAPDGALVATRELARAIGLRGRRGAGAYLERSLERAGRFGLVRRDPDGTVAVRRRLAPLTRAQVARLPQSLRAEHGHWEAARPVGLDAMRRRSRQLALSLLELGEDREATERQLLRWRYHPSLAYESTVWAWTRHQQAAQAVASSADAYEPRSSSSVRTPKPVAPLVV